MTEAARLIQSKCDVRPKIGVVLGSGLGTLADSLSNCVRVRYEDIPGLPASTAVGHGGELAIGSLGVNGQGAGRPDSVDIAIMCGRLHLYEGYTAQQVTSGIRLLHELGIERVILTNAAGGINPDYGPGALVLLTDHINLQGANPLIGENDDALGPRFPDMTEAYSPALRVLLREAAEQTGIALYEGVYAAVLGPSYETPAEIRFLKAIGADLVGMSTVLETVAANHLGMEVAAISCVTNMGAGLSGEKLNHEDVLAMGHLVAPSLLRLLSAALPKLDAR
ncbi:MAG: purine-nucleoside phosphorylase [Acidobacteriaceae bacterium]|nr:purine-nucleoside phosphorylase [Acidobacteriaceae bacterium]MBV9497843.1 purine-nucleoside phosphorylase [Acidobacteriaceae bacterium]